ncbi:MAG: multiple sugar transport system substrate-binding protein [Solirubrobacteraceae bacterium]|nr:multiple sugar transport system substrate-binding protein [Solirubrobacteraceae bacterium]
MSEDQDLRQGLTRAQVLKRGAAAAGAVAIPSALLAACGGDGGGSSSSGGGAASSDVVKLPATVDGKIDFGGVELKGMGDEFAGPIWEWYGDDLEKEANVKIAKPAKFAFGQESQVITPKLIGNTTPPWNVIAFGGWYLGDFVATGGLEPLDKYLKGFPGYEEYLNGIAPAYRELVMKSKGQIYGLMLDGDSHGFHYRTSDYEDKTLQRAHRQQLGRDLKAPETWEQYIETAGFFTKQLKGDNRYGAQFASEPAVSWAYWMGTAGSLGVQYFDANMKATVNSDAGVQGLELLLRLAEHCPPGMENMSNNDTVSNWTSGRVVQAVYWMDLTEFDSKVSQNDSSDTAVPGSIVNGELKRATALAFNRILGVPKNQPEETKRAAAWAAYRLSHPDYSIYSVADPFCGLEPYHTAHTTPAAIEQFTKPNPKRGTTADYPKNQGIYRTLTRAKNHVAAIQEALKTGFPQPNWPGSGEYIRVLGTEVQNAIAGQKNSKQAMDSVAQQWDEIVQKRGLKQQQEYYTAFQNSAKSIGL